MPTEKQIDAKGNNILLISLASHLHMLTNDFTSYPYSSVAPSSNTRLSVKVVAIVEPPRIGISRIFSCKVSGSSETLCRCNLLP